MASPSSLARTRLALLIGLVFWAGGALASELPILPAPLTWRVGEGGLQIGPGAGIIVPPRDPSALSDARWLAAEVMRDRGLKLSVARGPGTVVFIRTATGLGPEGYRLTVTAKGARIEASEDAGLFYGAVSLLQLMTPEDGGRGAVRVKALTVEDRPRYAWRGLMLDSARHYQSVAFIKAFLDQMSRFKLNTFHWHLTDDQAWRVEIKRYPLLTSKGAFRVEAGRAYSEDIDPKTGEPRLYGGFYSQAEIKDIVAYAATRHIVIVPEIEMPGHASAAIYAYPELGLKPVTRASLADWGVFPNLFNPTDATFAFLDNVLDEVMALFPGPFIHVGGDEAVKPYWKASSEVQAKIKALGLKDEDALQSWFIQRIERHLAAHGRRLIGWDEILQGGLPEGAAVMSWHGASGAETAARAGHDAVVSPVLPFYLDNRQSPHEDEPPSRGLVITLQNVYAFDPSPKGLPLDASAHILGLQANVWTEHIRLDDRVEALAFPRAMALAEMAWSPPSVQSWPDFLARVPEAIRREEAMGLGPSRSAFEVETKAALEPGGRSLRVSLATQSGLGEIRYTLDGADPAPSSALYASPLSLPLPSRLKAQAFLQSRPLAAPIDAELSRTSLLRKDNHALDLCTDKLKINLEDDAPVASDHRAVVLTDIENPCWIWRGADLSGIAGISADVANLPFNYELGADAALIPLPPPRTPDGELDVHLDTCGGPLIASLSLSPASANTGVTRLQGTLAATQGTHDLCFLFTRRRLDPIWALDAVELDPSTEHARVGAPVASAER